MPATKETIPDEIWWDSPYAEYEDFVGIGERRTQKLATFLATRGDQIGANRILHSNNLPHGKTNGETLGHLPNDSCYKEGMK